MKKYIAPLFVTLTLIVALIAVQLLKSEPKVPVPHVEPPKPVYVDPSLQSLVDKYQLYGVDIYLGGYNFGEDEDGHYSNIDQDIFIKPGIADLENTLNHEYIHYKQQTSPSIDWLPIYNSSRQIVRDRVESFYGEYNKEEVEAIFCTEIRNLPSPYIERCNFLLPNRAAIPFIIDMP